MPTNLISGISYWAKVHKPAVDDYNPDGIYSIDVAVDSKTEAQLKKLGLGKRIKNKEDDRGNFIQIKRKVKKRDGSMNTPVRVVDAQKNPIPETTLIGNGSKVNVLFDTYDYDVAGNKGVGSALKAVQVIDLVSYKEELGDLPKVKGGFESPADDKPQQTNGQAVNKDGLDDELPF
jgi:hypothetical protein|tara:strand:- start:115 stop:642 length:528 start_codon:yes stop_codon:yes gene_type:complete